MRSDDVAAAALHPGADAGAAVEAANTSGVPAASVESQELWWNAPANSESGWGIIFAQQGSVIFASWFAYDVNGKSWWLSMTANKTGSSPDTYRGSTVPCNPSLVTRTLVGSGTLTFNDVNRGGFKIFATWALSPSFHASPLAEAGPNPSLGLVSTCATRTVPATTREKCRGICQVENAESRFLLGFSGSVCHGRLIRRSQIRALVGEPQICISAVAFTNIG